MHTQTCKCSDTSNFICLVHSCIPMSATLKMLHKYLLTEDICPKATQSKNGKEATRVFGIVQGLSTANSKNKHDITYSQQKNYYHVSIMRRPLWHSQ